VPIQLDETRRGELLNLLDFGGADQSKKLVFDLTDSSSQARSGTLRDIKCTKNF
jgi:hypothetical protein